jgi:1,4-alpha-glucan branching enzyme
MYVYSENFILPLSHDEVVHGKGSLLGKMPGDDWQKFANLRLLLGYMYGLQGKKLLFMGGEFGQWQEWNHDQSLGWHLLKYPPHAGIQHWVEDLNRFYRSQPALYQKDYESPGFEWIDANDVDSSVISFLRRGQIDGDTLLFICNFTPVTRFNYMVGAPKMGYWTEMLNSDARDYGGSGQGNLGGVRALNLCTAVPLH